MKCEQCGATMNIGDECRNSFPCWHWAKCPVCEHSAEVRGGHASHETGRYFMTFEEAWRYRPPRHEERRNA